MATTEEILLPDLGDFAEIPVIEILVEPGERVTPEQSLVTLESDKATMEIPAPKGGIVRELRVAVGDKVSTGDPLLALETNEAPQQEAATASTPDSAPDSPPAETAQPSPDEEAPPTEETPPDDSPETATARRPGDKAARPAPLRPRPADLAAVAQGRTPHASPAVRRFARELGVELARVKGSGPKGRILKEDVQAFVQQALRQGSAVSPGGQPFDLPAAPEVDFSRFGPVEEVPLARIQRISGAHLHRCWLTVPHVTQFDEADITELEAFRRAQQQEGEHDVKLTFLPFLLKAVATALVAQPRLKASLTPDGESLILKHYTHIGVAVDTPNGLVVPVVRDVDEKGVLALARELADLSAKARAGKLLPGDMQGGCFSISSLGGIGGTAFTPIVNAPEVAVLGVARATQHPVWDGSAFVPRTMLPLALSYDHRVVDGAEGARFTQRLARLLGDIRRLLL
ncbi:pyruvate dehydrogenase complex dihydrolipoamide acetyltransferase, long form [Thioflavicoccus mobilis 8321]|uniref:Acetyltransferase component of pyruvate dehydrogenase complex n=1 Tax=Thioflavicoccus mobilis 8321 TaxID=765912 RepID=L0GWZ1_9GAMM|nr:dihydrolipoyllysine-residue acetyltransferase [Thioflavicoccus mobilis]AGA89890.1 pyruvate dehydrogenase complex dihydrolipoamide acetyltransferase, long form [Thioflavicoccus mobilis 8321]